jgi:hypothetical protein
VGGDLTFSETIRYHGKDRGMTTSLPPRRRFFHFYPFPLRAFFELFRTQNYA